MLQVNGGVIVLLNENSWSFGNWPRAIVFRHRSPHVWPQLFSFRFGLHRRFERDTSRDMSFNT
jgi:hypothetical protein